MSASQAGDIQFLDIRNDTTSYLTIDAHRGSLTALAVHRHAPVIASGSAKQIVKVFSLEGEQLSIIRYYPTFMAQRIGSVSCLTFHPYRVLLAAGAADAFVSIYADDSSQVRWYNWFLLQGGEPITYAQFNHKTWLYERSDLILYYDFRIILPCWYILLWPSCGICMLQYSLASPAKTLTYCQGFLHYSWRLSQNKHGT